MPKRHLVCRNATWTMYDNGGEEIALSVQSPGGTAGFTLTTNEVQRLIEYLSTTQEAQDDQNRDRRHHGGNRSLG